MTNANRYAIAIEHSGAVAVYDQAVRAPEGDVLHESDTREECEHIIAQIATRSVEGDGWVVRDWHHSFERVRQGQSYCARLAYRRMSELAALAAKWVL